VLGRIGTPRAIAALRPLLNIPNFGNWLRAPCRIAAIGLTITRQRRLTRCSSRGERVAG